MFHGVRRLLSAFACRLWLQKGTGVMGKQGVRGRGRTRKNTRFPR